MLHALKAVRDGEDPASAIKNFVNHCKNTTNKGKLANKENGTSEIERLSGDISKIVISEVAPNKNDTATTPDAHTDTAREDEIEALKKANEKLQEDFQAMKEECQAKVRECKKLVQERDVLSKC